MITKFHRVPTRDACYSIKSINLYIQKSVGRKGEKRGCNRTGMGE